DNKGRLMLDDLENKLRKYGDKVALVAITGASNVTGYINPIHKIAEMTHSHGAKLLVDGAQLVPHVPVDMKPFYSPEHIDFLTFSGHKMYAPFGIGVLIGPKEFFKYGAPELTGGGTVKAVTHDFVCWADSPYKEEAGTPNLMGVVALSTAIDILTSIGMDHIEAYERVLTKYAISKMICIPNIKIYGDIENLDNRVAIISFNIKDLPHGLVASALSYEAAISVRSGCFCAHPYIQKLLGLSPEEIQKQIKTFKSPYAGMVRVSFGLYNTKEEIDILVDKLWEIALNPNEYRDKYRPI
ncbi:MAG: aminotransferase class V-fold PLP-dependent enzyme, partial [Clostridiales bacterium]|nr:aminotransferase class V-fold PLP-dependent enzyme [Clostridiales bacterium]